MYAVNIPSYTLSCTPRIPSSYNLILTYTFFTHTHPTHTPHPHTPTQVRTGLVVTFTLSELLLLTKALIIALGADDALWPAPLEHPGQCGLVLLLGATGSAAVMMVAQFVLATSVVQRCVFVGGRGWGRVGGRDRGFVGGGVSWGGVGGCHST